MSQKFNAVEAWIDNVAYSHSKSERTPKNYRHHLGLFCAYVGKTAEQILLEYESSDERTFRRKYAQFIKGWISTMTHENLAIGTIIVRVAAIKSFFKYSDMTLGMVPTGKNSVEYHNRDIAKDEVVLLLQAARPRERAFFAVMAQSGLRPDTICDLKLKHLEPDFSKGTIPCKIDVPKEITKGQYRGYYTFIGVDAVRYLKAYLATRRNLNSESYLFTDYESSKHAEKPLGRSNISVRFQKLATNLRTTGKLSYELREDGKPSELRLYTLRKYFRKYANQAGFEFVQFWMGHIVNMGREENYRPTDPEFHRQLYAEKAMPFLRLESGTPTETEAVIQKQAEEIEKLKTVIANWAPTIERLNQENLNLRTQQPKASVIHSGDADDLKQEIQALREKIEKLEAQEKKRE